MTARRSVPSFGSLLFFFLALAGCGGSDDEATGGAGPTSSGEGGGGGSPSTGPGGAAPLGPCSTDADCLALEAPQCWVAVCNAGELPAPVGQCFLLPTEAAPCDDGQFCTLGDTCAEGACVGTPNTCGQQPGTCEDIVCDEASQACSSAPSENGTDCDSDDLCLFDTVCDRGQCTGKTKNCPQAQDSCTTDLCQPTTGECETEPDLTKNGAFCVADDLCLVGSSCLDGQCLGGEPQDCSFFDQGCLIGVCDPGVGFCSQEPVPVGGACDPQQPCADTGVCDAAGACQPFPWADGTACSDGSSCTSGETCTAGECGGGVTLPLEVYFAEDFSSNAAGWQLDTEWEIGPAVPPDPNSFAPDPSLDHSPSLDNGMAGAVIGGDVDYYMHPYYFLTSPPIDVSAVSGPLYLEFWRYLNTDFIPYMENSIDVWDGTAWVDLWTTDQLSSVFDVEWTRQASDITPYKNAQLKVRFGHSVPVDGFFGYSGWNVDDVRLANQSCD